VLLPFPFEILEAFGGFGTRSDRFWNDDVWRRCVTNDCSEPPERGRAPIGPARVAEVMPEQESFEPQFPCLEALQGLFTRPAEVADGLVLHRRDIDEGEVA